MKDGEVYDARLEMPGWCTAGYDDAGWKPVRVAAHPKNHLVASMGVPVRRKETFTPQAIITTPKGETVIDFGQNLAGVVRIRVQGPPGTTVHLIHGETLDADGNFTQAHLFIPPARPGVEPFQEDFYTLKGAADDGGLAVEEYEPRFTVHGFRYVKLEGYPGRPSPDNFLATRHIQRHAAHGCVHLLRSAPQPTPPQRRVEHEEQLPRPAHRLPSARARRLDRRRADLRAHRPRSSWTRAPSSASGWPISPSSNGLDGAVGSFIPNPIRLAKGRSATFFKGLDGSAGWGDCRGHLALGALPGLRRPRGARAAV